MFDAHPHEAKARWVWNQGTVPVILRRAGAGERLRLRIPLARNTLIWLQHGKRIAPVWLSREKCWQTPKAWFNDLVEMILRRHKKIYIIQPFREQEKCSPACLN